MSSSEDECPGLDTLDISNDQYYGPPCTQSQQTIGQTNLEAISADDEFFQVPKYSSNTIRHSIPAYDLWKPFFPTYLNVEKFRNFHRPKLRHYNTGPQARSRRGTFKPFPVKNLSRTIFRYQKKLRFKVIRAINSGMSREEIINKILLIREAKDLSAKFGELFLFEYCEEFPPILSQVGMAANVKTYSWLSSSDITTPSDKLNQQVSGSNTSANTGNQTQFGHNSQGKQVAKDNNEFGFNVRFPAKQSAKPIYYSQPRPGAKFKVIETNLYRAPIFEHEFSSCNFLIIRTRNSFYIRPVKTIFTVGQTMPLVAIPQPTESNIQKFRCDLSNVYMHKLFKESDSEPQTIRIDKLEKLFPDYPANALKRRLRLRGAAPTGCKYDSDNVFVRGQSNFGLLSLLDLRRSFLPEHYCLSMATLAARQRLRELNYTESMILPTNDAELETEVLAAPWNTSKAVLGAMSNKNYLDFKSHLIDPTGSQREGFSCVAWSKSPTEEQQAKAMRSEANKPSEEPVKFQEKNPLLSKIKREKLERLAIYQKEAQIISEVQSRVLASDEAITSSEDESGNHDDNENSLGGDFEQQLNDLDKLVIGCQSVGELDREKEEEERRRLLADLRLNGSTSQTQGKEQGESQAKFDFNLASVRNKILKITRTYHTTEGEIQRTEIVREPRIIALYTKKRGGNPRNIQETNELTNGDSSRLNISISSTKSDGAMFNSQKSRSSSLGPSELCRADGTILTISKKVLESTRPMRLQRRRSIAK